MTRFPLLFAFFFALAVCPAAAQSDTFKVINWNIEWFGKGSKSHVSAQTEKVKLLMQEMNADVYALTEIVNVDSLESVVSSLGGDFGWYVSSYGSFAPAPASPDYAGAQKLAFVYRKSKVQVTERRPFMKSSSSAYNSFASGRFPFYVAAEVKGADDNWHPVKFLIIHAKAMSDNSSCNRRSNGAKELKDSLDLYFPHDNFLILGDFNDDLDVSICTGDPISNYQNFVSDTARYQALTLPLSLAGVSSISGYPSFLDHVIASNEMAAYYVPGSATSLKSYVTGLAPDYVSKVSDHYPTSTLFVLDDHDHSTLAALTPGAPVCQLFPNPAQGQVTVSVAQQAKFQFRNTQGEVLSSGGLKPGRNSLSLTGTAPGIYWLMVWNEQGKSVQKLVVR